MLTVEALGKIGNISLKITQALAALEVLDKDANKRVLLNRLESLQAELGLLIPPEYQDNRQLMELVLSPPKSIFFDAKREICDLSMLKQWAHDRVYDDDSDNRTIAELSLLFYFGTHAAMDRFIQLNNEKTSPSTTSAIPPKLNADITDLAAQLKTILPLVHSCIKTIDSTFINIPTQRHSS